MKKFVFSLLLSFCVVATFAQQIQQSYHFSDYEISQKGDFQLISLDNCLNSAEVGSPMIPWQTVSILLPQNTKAVSVSIEKTNPMTLPNSVSLFPMQKNAPISMENSGIFEQNHAVYQSSKTYPTNDLGNFCTQYLRGYGFAQTAFSPVEYIPSTGQITIYQEVVVTISYKQSHECNILPSNNIETLDAVKNLAQNSEALPSYATTQKSDHAYDILIITGTNFINNFGDLTDMYLKKGLLSEIKSVADIYSEMDGRDNQEKIRNYIIQEVNESQISHVILGGDVDVVPYRGFYCSVQSSSLYEDNNIPADLYYSALDGTWNDDNDNSWGEIGEDDLIPDISVGRMSFSNATELTKMIHKSVSYQMTPVLNELTKVLLAGEWMYDNPLTYGGDQLDMLIGYKDEHGYITDGIPSTHDIYTLYDRDLPYEWSSYDLMNLMNQGYPFIDHAGHSNWNYVMRMSNYDIYNENFSGMNGLDHNYSVIYSHGCIAGAFDESDCIGEMMTKIDNLAVAVFFNSRYGWFNEGQTEGPSLHINREFCDEIYTQNNTNLGTAHYLSKVATAPFVNAPGQWEEGALRWCFYDCNLLGDPVLQMWTNEAAIPTAQFADYMLEGQTELQLHSLANATVSLLIDGQLVSKGVTDGNGNLLLSFSPIEPFVEGNIWISGINILPTAFPVFFNGTAPCNPPTGLFVSKDDATLALTLAWDQVPNALQYKIYRDGSIIISTTDIEFVDSEIDINTEYCYSVVSVCEDGESEPSSSICATYDYSCAAPADLTATATEHQILLSWTTSLDGDNYIIYRNDEIIATVSEQTSYLDENLADGNYCYQIKTECAYMESDFSNESCATVPSVSNLELSDEEILIFPNPASEIVQIFLPKVNSSFIISLFDVQGRMIKSLESNGNSVFFNLLDVPAGIYTIQIKDNQSITSRKLIVK